MTNNTHTHTYKDEQQFARFSWSNGCSFSKGQVWMHWKCLSFNGVRYWWTNETVSINYSFVWTSQWSETIDSSALSLYYSMMWTKIMCISKSKWMKFNFYFLESTEKRFCLRAQINGSNLVGCTCLFANNNGSYWSKHAHILITRLFIQRKYYHHCAAKLNTINNFMGIKFNVCTLEQKPS